MDVRKFTAGIVDAADEAHFGKTQRDIVALGIAVAAIIMFLGTGGAVLPSIMRSILGHGLGPDRMLSNALLLNVALVIFGWRRYRELSDEVRERRRAEAQARVLAETDPLTGCLNRRSIAPATDRLIQFAATRGRAVAFVMLDLDNFKLVNDVHGHAAGDALLRETTSRIAAELPDEALLARLGGDEFACVLDFDPLRPEQIDRLIDSIVGAIARPVENDERRLEVTVSAGIARSDLGHGGHDAKALMHMGDIAMYQAKKHGKNKHRWFEPTMEEELRLRGEIEAGIRNGLPRGEFVPFYQKQIDLSNGEVVGFEMLARWNSPTLGMVLPEVFIPVAEEIGLIAELSEQLIAQALRDARDWDPELTLAVNISPIQLRDPWFAHKLLKLLHESGFPPQRFEVEITETCLHDNIGTARALIDSLKAQGVRISLDDFGTGYSSLAHLRSLPFDRIKIDRSFVTSLPGNPESASIIQAITALGEGLGLPIIAEGVESEEVLDELKRFGSFKAQGFLYGQPQPARQTMADLARLDRLLELPSEGVLWPGGKARKHLPIEPETPDTPARKRSA